MADVTRYELRNYFDVWMESDGTWTVNNSCIEFDDLMITDDASDKEILEYLVDIGFLATADRRKIRIDDCGDILEIYQVKGYKPIAALIPVYN